MIGGLAVLGSSQLCGEEEALEQPLLVGARLGMQQQRAQLLGHAVGEQGRPALADEREAAEQPARARRLPRVLGRAHRHDAPQLAPPPPVWRHGAGVWLGGGGDAVQSVPAGWLGNSTDAAGS